MPARPRGRTVASRRLARPQPRRLAPAPRSSPRSGSSSSNSIAAGIAAGDAMAKRAPIEVIRAGTVHPGKYLVLVGGAVADVEEALEAGQEAAAGYVRDVVFLPNVHPGVVARHARRPRSRPAERRWASSRPRPWRPSSRPPTQGSRARASQLLELRLADDLGGKGYLLFDGPVSEVEAAVEAGVARVAAARPD